MEPTEIVSLIALGLSVVSAIVAGVVGLSSRHRRREVHDVAFVLQQRGENGFAWHLVNFGLDDAVDVRYRFAITGGLQGELLQREPIRIGAGAEVLLDVMEEAKEIGRKPPVAGVVYWRTNWGQPRSQFLRTDGSDMYAEV